MEKDEIVEQFALFSFGTAEITGWLTPDTDDEVFRRLGRIDNEPLSEVQLNQLLVFGREAPVSDGFFRYYWLSAPGEHPYDVEKLPGFESSWLGFPAIVSLEHLKWGLYRLYTDGLLWFGNVGTAFPQLATMAEAELEAFFRSRRVDTELIKQRGPALPLKEIPKDDRYLISEMACKSYGDRPESASDLREALAQAYLAHRERDGGPVTIRQLLKGDVIVERYRDRQMEFIFSTDDVLDETVSSLEELDEKYEGAAAKFFGAREAALANTRQYLSMVNDLDVYVATSMRTRQDFREMATVCETIFADDRLMRLDLRYFDPTLSAASGHEDKGLIECLMVKCAKAFVYCAGEKESYGKDVEAAMALSLGKPVIFYCDEEKKSRFYRDVHPLSRLIEFETGVAVGAMVTASLDEVSELLYRIFENKMEYRLEQPKPGYLKLKESLTGSVVRLQTSDELLAATFRNLYPRR